MLSRARQRIDRALGATTLATIAAEQTKLRQAARYLALAQLRERTSRDSTDLTVSELTVFSQNGEDGVLQEILGRIGAGDRHFAEIGVHVNEGNCVLLADAFGWHGLFVDADPGEVANLQRKYRHSDRVTVLQTLITRDNIEEVLGRANVPVDLDVLSIDVDGNDYWIWQAVKAWSPRIVVIECNSNLDPAGEQVQPYSSGAGWSGTAFFGASVGALRHLGASRGYQLVHIDLTGTNAFFVRTDQAANHFVSEAEVVFRAVNIYLSGQMHAPPSSEGGYLNLRD